jgi:excinuclease ABC subunit C
MTDPREFALRLPHLPGVYRMLNASGEVLYVGKALDLRKRAASYFQGTPDSPRVAHMVSQVARIEATVTRSEAEALLLENNLIKTLSPRYNILFRDDKSYPYLMLSGHRFPRLGFHRGSLDGSHRYFGPFPNAGAVRASIQLMQKVFHIRTCEDSVFDKRSRPCLLHQIRRCTGPCVGLISESEYAADVRAAELFLEGKGSEVEAMLTERMDQASEAMRYEDAATFRDQLAALRKVREKQYVSDEAGQDVDVIACARSTDVVCVNLVMIRGGQHLGDRNFFPRNAEEYGDEQVLEAFMAQHYLHHDVPAAIVAALGEAREDIERMLAVRAARPVRIVGSRGGTRRAWMEMAAKNAQLAAEQAASQRTNQDARLHALRQALDLPDTVQRIECFDVSHTMGEAAVASCVVFDDGALRNGEYRRYNVRLATPGDDYAAMREVLARRYRRTVSGEGKVPDLVLIDGGVGQLNVAQEVLAELGMSDIAVVAVAKGEERKPGLEQLLRPSATEPLRLPPDHAGLHLVQQIRDEAHRFAVAGHRRQRATQRTTSSLESIAGIGARRRQRLLVRFGGLRGILAASIEDLARVPGISRALAERIHRELH